jgi:TM2 domain-containing membrane protein YozV
MKKILVLLFVVSFAAISNLSAASYKLDDSKIDAMFETANEASLSIFAQELNLEVGDTYTASSIKDKDGVVAFVLCWVFGTLGVHRFYLGTKPLTGVAYILTLGGCGVVTLVDWVVLLIDMNDVSKYVNNPKFFMW